MIAGDVLEALGPAAAALEALGVAYHIGGSIASSAHGIARATLDVDLVADLRTAQCEEFVRLLSDSYYVDADRVRDAALCRTSFNMIHLATMVKLDVFVLKDEPFHRESFGRARPCRLESAAGSRPFPVASAEDVVLHKLLWYRAGGEVSDRQWKDVLGILRVQSGRLDRAYLARWAESLGLSGLLQRACSEAGAP